MPRIHHLILWTLVLLVAPGRLASAGQPVDIARLSKQLTPFLHCIGGKCESYALSAKVEVPDGDRKHNVSVRLDQIDAESFNLEVKHDDYWLNLQRLAAFSYADKFKTVSLFH